MESAGDVLVYGLWPMAMAIVASVAWWFVSRCLTLRQQSEWAESVERSSPVRERVLLAHGSPHDRLFVLGLLSGAGLMVVWLITLFVARAS